MNGVAGNLQNRTNRDDPPLLRLPPGVDRAFGTIEVEEEAEDVDVDVDVELRNGFGIRRLQNEGCDAEAAQRSTLVENAAVAVVALDKP